MRAVLPSLVVCSDDMRLFYLISVAAILVGGWYAYPKFFPKEGKAWLDKAFQSQSQSDTYGAGSSPKQGLTPEQIRNRKEILRLYERKLQDAGTSTDRKRFQEKIDAIQKELAGG